MYFARKICTTFPETLSYLPENKGEFIGAIVRPELKEGDSDKGRFLCGFNREKPVIFVAGGSLGSVAINEVIPLSARSTFRRFSSSPYLWQREYQ